MAHDDESQVRGSYVCGNSGIKLHLLQLSRRTSAISVSVSLGMESVRLLMGSHVRET